MRHCRLLRGAASDVLIRANVAIVAKIVDFMLPALLFLMLESSEEVLIGDMDCNETVKLLCCPGGRWMLWLNVLAVTRESCCCFCMSIDPLSVSSCGYASRRLCRHAWSRSYRITRCSNPRRYSQGCSVTGHSRWIAPRPLKCYSGLAPSRLRLGLSCVSPLA